MKLLRKIKIGLLITMVAVVVFTGVAIYQSQMASKKEAFNTSEIVFEQNKVEKDVVVKALKENFQIVGMEGKIEKEFGYEDKLFDAKWGWVQELGERAYTTTLKGSFKMGFDTNAITENHIFIEADGIKIITPAVVLISLELPYDKMEIKEDVGLLRREFMESEKQYIYGKAKQKIEEELMNDEAISKEAKEKTKAHLVELLEKLTEGQKVEFVDL